MPLAPGTRVGAYDIDSLLGAGGMGEVYRARDARLQRSVAIKILPSTFATDSERLARFEREAQVLASLNHPNIAQIYGVEETGGALALVMELVDGPTLAKVIADRGPQHRSATSRSGTWDVDPLAIGRQLADALEAAHDQGIIHRDLKPQNIILRRDGTVKVLDFGLAKALDSVAGEQVDNSPTITNTATRAGTLLGTAAYMAPEQVKGRPADRRADIWAFGVVLYELWTGSVAFAGDSVAEILARVIEREPDWSKLPTDTPPAIVRLLRRALVKDPRRRLQSIGDARLELEEAKGSGEAPAAIVSDAPRIRRWLAMGLALIVCTVGGIAAGRWMRPAATVNDVPPLRASIALPPGLFLDGAGPPELALSPDGRSLAFLARGATGFQRLYVRALGSETATLVPDSEAAEGPFFSPDGRWVAFAVGVSFAGSAPELRKYSLETRLTQTIATITDYFGGLWLDADTILFVNHQPAGLWRVNSAGGQAQQLAAKWILDGQEVERPIAWPSLVPGTRSLVLTDWEKSRIGHLVVVDIDSRRMVNLGIEGSGGQVLPNGYLVYANLDAALMAVRFDISNRRSVGTPVALMPDIALGRNEVPVFATAADGTLTFAPGYLRGSRREPLQVMKISPTGTATPLTFEPDLFFRGFELSPDGTRLAIGLWDGSRSVLDLRRGTRQKVPNPSLTHVSNLSWHPDGRTMAVSGPLVGTSAWGIVVDSTDRSRSDPLIREPHREVYPAGWLPGGRAHIAWTSGEQTVSIVRKDDGQEPQTIVTERGFVRTVRISPDGGWLAYDSNNSGPFHVYVVPVSGKGDRITVSPRPSESPRWSHDGKRLFFRSGTAMMAVDVRATGDQIEFGAERKLFDAQMPWEYAVAPTGDFYTLTPVPGAATQTHIQLRTRWFDEVDRLMRGSERRP